MGIVSQQERDEAMREARDAEVGMRQGAGRRTRWRVEFPYHWDADELIGRRNLLRFAVMASGALFASTGAIAALAQWRPLRTVKRMFIAKTGDVAPNSATYFTYPESGEQAMLLRLDNGNFVAYSQRCTHLSCAVYFDAGQRRLICPCHDGVFDPQTGVPIAGPPQRPLAKITLQQDGDNMYATAEDPA
jgi:Rieske Fe-S protein